jgi:hypothetical protein
VNFVVSAVVNFAEDSADNMVVPVVSRSLMETVAA